MKSFVVMVAILCLPAASMAQRGVLSLEEVVESAQQWAKENLDEDALQSLETADQQKVREFFAALQKDFHGEYVIELGRFRESARLIIPLLEADDETFPFAIWLKTRLDYLDIANELSLVIPAPDSAPGKTPAHPENPSPAIEREIWIKKVSERPWPAAAKPHVDKLKLLFAREGIPAELVWIAEVESSFDPRAQSPVGAAGLFQLMPATAKQYGLRTWPFDQRYAVEESAVAAAKHLRHLFGLFKDWRLALAAYNAGEGRVGGLLKRENASSFDAIAPKLPAETQMYVPKVEAVLLKREGIKLTDLPPPQKKSK